jgi:hypothetical protein
MNTKKTTPNEWADFWSGVNGVNVFPVDIKNTKPTYDFLILKTCRNCESNCFGSPTIKQSD